MKIGIVGSRGIPNNYGGFEECAQQLAPRLVKMGHEVTVYNSHRHPYNQKTYQGVSIVHKYDPEHRIGTAGQFIYDLNCMIDAWSRQYDVILLLGYTSSSIWQRFLPPKAAVLCNMDGLEWRRSKYSPRIRQFLKRAERWAATRSHLMIADSEVIQQYLHEQYGREVVYLTYGAKIFKKPEPATLQEYGIGPGNYNLLIARLEPENNIELILKGVVQSSSERVCLVVGDHETSYGEKLKKQFKDNRIRFVKGLFDKEELNNLRHYAHIYFHGHSVGGTNPSLLEAMACQCMIVAHRNPFNLEVLGDQGNYFIDEKDVTNALDHLERNDVQKQRVKENMEKLRTKYNWDLVAEQYEVVCEQARIGLNR